MSTEQKKDSNQMQTQGKRWRGILITILIFLIVLCVGGMILNRLGYLNFKKEKPVQAILSGDLFPGANGEDGTLPNMTQEEVKEQLQKIADVSNFSYKINAQPEFATGDSEGNLFIENPNYNVYPMVVQIALEDAEDDIIYDSGGLMPNQHISMAKLNRVLPAGEYKAVATIYMYHPETQENVGKTQAGLTIKILGS